MVPTHLPPLDPGTAQLWFVAPPADTARLEPLLSADEAARAARFRHAPDRLGFVTLHAAARILLGRLLDRPPARLAFRQPPGHKPTLDDAPGLDFSLSRTRGTCAIAVGAARIGVDVEAVRPLPDAGAIADRFFAPREAQRLAALPAAARHEAFFACWTRKEAYVKAIGLGLVAAFDRFEVDIDPAHPALLAIDGDPAAATPWSVWAARHETCWAAAALEHRHATIRSATLDLAAWHP